MSHFRHSIILFLFSLFLLGNISAQTCNRSSKIYRDFEKYKPSSDFPELTLKLNFVFLQRDDGCCGFSKSNPEHMDIVNKIMKHVNKKYRVMVDPKDDRCYKGDEFILDTKIRFKLNEIIEIKDDYLWNLDNGGSCPNDGNWYLNKIDSVIFKNPQYTNCINIYFPNSLENYEMLKDTVSLEDLKYSHPCSQLPSNKKLIRSSKLCMPNKFVKYYTMKNYTVNDPTVNKKGETWEEAIYFWFWEPLASGIAHELGHSMGLMHSNKHHGANKCPASIMNQKHGNSRNYLPPSEIGKMHRNMRMTNIRYFLDKEVFSAIPWVIDTNTVVDVNYKVYEDIIIKSGATLRITCHLEMSPETSIYIEEGGMLDLSEGTVSAIPGKQWNGIFYPKKKKCFLKKNKEYNELRIINQDNLSGYMDIKSTNRK